MGIDWGIGIHDYNICKPIGFRFFWGFIDEWGNEMHKSVYYILVMILFGWSGLATASITDSWTAIYATDATGDTGNGGHPYLDIAGGTDVNGLDFAGGYLHYQSASSNPQLTEDLLSFRFRLDGIKNKMPGAYQIFFETTGDTSVDWALQLTTDDLNTSGTLEFGTASGADRSGVAFTQVEWSGTYADYVDYSGTPTDDGSRFNGDADYFLEFSMPWQQFSSSTGITSPNGNMCILMSTSQNQGSLMDGDIAGTTSSGNVAFSDVYVAIPEPAVASLVGGFGIAFLFGRRIFHKD